MYRTMLCSEGNLDHGQYVAVSPSVVVRVKTIRDAVTACREYIYEWNLGSGNWCGDAGKVFNSQRLIARITYNGKVLVEL